MKRILSVLLCLVLLLGSVAFAGGSTPVCEHHYFDVWYYRREGIHRSVCKHEGCDFVPYVACGEMSADFEGKTLTVCPVCGHFGDTDGSYIPLVRADLYNYGKTPEGEFCVYRYDDPFEDGSVKTALSVIFEKGGREEAYDGGFRVHITTPIEGDFTVLNAAGEEIESSYENGVLTFTSDSGSGIYFVR